MTAQGGGHGVVIEVDEPAEVAVGADFVLAVRVSCPAGCDLSGLPVEVTTPDGAAIAATAVAGDHGVGEARSVALRAPLAAGEHVWRIACAAQASDRGEHAAAELALPIRVRPHETSLAVWAIPSPVVTGQCFAIKVGARSTTGCTLSGQAIAVCDEAGEVLARGVLGDTPWLGTSALYWTELGLAAPAKAGMFSWAVRFDAAALALAHNGTSSRFSIAIVDPPQHRLSVKVVARETAMPIEAAQVRLGPYRAATDHTGLAEIMMPKGSFDLAVWKSGYEAPDTAVVIEADVRIEVAIAAAPEEDLDATWQM